MLVVQCANEIQIDIMTPKEKATPEKPVMEKKVAVKRITKPQPTIGKTAKEDKKTFQQRILSSPILTEEEQKLLQIHKTLKLQFELVPGTCWWSNVRNNVSAKQWDYIRNSVYLKANYLAERKAQSILWTVTKYGFMTTLP